MGRSKPLRVVIYSFGFKYGVPVDANMIWDVRFLPNPYWDASLRPKTGKIKEVAEYVLQSSEGRSFLLHLEPLLHFLVEQNSAAGKQSLRIAIGCTGGMHRSVAVSESIAHFLAKFPIELTVFHRDIERDRERYALPL